MEKETLNQVIDRVSKMYRETTGEANKLSRKYDELLQESTQENVSHKRYVRIEEELKHVGAEVNNKYHIAQGVSDVREMLFTLL